jgi:hypothetical protein
MLSFEPLSNPSSLIIFLVFLSFSKKLYQAYNNLNTAKTESLKSSITYKGYLSCVA